jgi:hypothetical protein
MTKLSRVWKKSSRSDPGGNCVEVRQSQTGDVQVRDSKDPDGPVLTFASAQWDAFVTGTKAGDFSF